MKKEYEISQEQLNELIKACKPVPLILVGVKTLYNGKTVATYFGNQGTAIAALANIIKSIKVTFTIEAFWPEEGGMGSDSYGGDCETIEEAIHTLELARKHNHDTEWIIVGTVETVTGGA